MSAIHPKYGWDGIRPTYEVFENILGGQLVMPDTATGKVKVCTANLMPLGVAMTDAVVAGTSDTTTDAFGNQVINASLPPNYVAVAMQGVFSLVNAGAALVLGDYVKAAAAGQVTKGVPGTDLIIGKVINPLGGATSAKVDVFLSLFPSGNIT